MADARDDATFERLRQIEENGAFRFYRPLKDAAYEFIHWASTPEQRVYTGLQQFDYVMGGTAPSEMTLIQGFTHSGKTLLATEILVNNPDTPIILFTPDETRPLVLTKLTTATQGISARELEKRIQQDDEAARMLMLETAERYAKLAIFEESVTLSDMDKMLDETTHALGERPKAFMFDYADLLAGFDDVRSALTALKQWGKRHGLPGFVLHQASRTSGSSGRKMAIDSGAYGGEQQATHVIGVRRKKYQHLAAMNELEQKIANATNPNSIAEYESRMREIKDVLLPLDENTITISLVKNKRPPCDLLDDQDFRIDLNTGRMTRIDQYQDASGAVIRVDKAKLHTIRSEQKTWVDREFIYE